MTLIANDTSTVMLALGLALVVMILLRRSYRYFGRFSRRQTPAIEEVARPRTTSRQVLDDAPTELLRWQVEMHETVRDLKAELDTKISVVRQLMVMAADQQEKLERSIARAERLGIPRGRDTLAEIRNAPALPSDSEEQHSRQDLLAGLPPATPTSQGRLTDQHQAVSRLANQGLGSAVIAQQLGLPVGDVEMLMSLRPNQSVHARRQRE